MTKELVERLCNGVPAFGMHEDNSTELFDIEDANETMREAADTIEALQAEIERLTFDGIHTCHDDCPRLPCVQRREIYALRAEVRHLMNELQAHKDALAQVKGSSDD